jgi:endoglycosylceramidase
MDSSSTAEYDLLEELGFTVIRLGYMWTGAEPAERQFNQTYIDTIKRIVGRLADRGIYTLLDMHEDVLSSKFCLYDGVPLWVIDKSTPLLQFPFPLEGNCSSRGWEVNSLSLAAATAYQNIYDNHKGMLDDLVGFWEESARQFLHIPGVIGYETMNEPQPGNFFEDPLLGVPGVAGAKNLIRMHDAVAAGIRKHDQRHIVFFEPVTWGMVFNGTDTGSGFTRVPGGPEYMNTSAYSYHWYGKEKLQSELVYKAVDEDLATFGGSSMMTEGLACRDEAMAGCEVVLNQLDDHLQSWTDYGYSQGETFDPSAKQQKSWARTYARAIGGRPLNTSFNIDTKIFRMCFMLDPSQNVGSPDDGAETEIFASIKHIYPGGAAVTHMTDNLKLKGTKPITRPEGIVANVFMISPADPSHGKEDACVTVGPA